MQDWPHILAEMSFDNQVRWCFGAGIVYVLLMMFGMGQNSYGS